MAKGKSSSAHRKAACQASWSRGESRKETRRKEQEAAAKRNAANPASAPWVTAKALRAAKRRSLVKH